MLQVLIVKINNNLKISILNNVNIIYYLIYDNIFYKLNYYYVQHKNINNFSKRNINVKIKQNIKL